jgi:hypothetical protein
MKNSWILLVTGLVMPVWGITLHRRDNPAVVQMDIQRNDISNPVARDQARRKRSTVSQALDNEVHISIFRYIILRHILMFLPRKLYTSVMSLWVPPSRPYVWFSTLEVVICGAIHLILLSVHPPKTSALNPVLTTRPLPLPIPL